MKEVPKLVVAIVLGSAAAFVAPVKSQPVPRTDLPSTDAPLPAMQSFELRQDTFAEREEFLRRRAAEMRQQEIERVKPLPAQVIKQGPAPK